jgi:ankyrin repeat protein
MLDLEGLKEAIHEGADLEGNICLLFEALYTPSITFEMVKFLIDLGADVRKYNKGYDANSPFLHICKNEVFNLEIFKLLISKGLDVNGRYERYFFHRTTYLHIVVENNNHVAARILLENGADFNARNSEGKIAFDHPNAKSEEFELIRKQYDSMYEPIKEPAF